MNQRLRRDDLEEKGKLQEKVAEKYEFGDGQEEILRLRDQKAHKLSITCLVVSPDGRHVFTGSKEAGIVKWRLLVEDGKVERVTRVVGGKKGCEAKHKGHCTAVNAMAMSTDGKLLVRTYEKPRVHLINNKMANL